MKSKKQLKREWIRQCREHTLLCYLCCQLILNEGEITADHTIPKSQGGLSDESNLRPAHWLCNNLRGTMPINEFQVILYHKYDGNTKNWITDIRNKHKDKSR